MSKPIRVLRGTIDRNGKTVPVRATIAAPERSVDATDWQCAVRCAFLFGDEEKRIAGVDAAQALDLAERFLRDLLAARGVALRAP